MSKMQKILLFFLLPIIAPVLYPPSSLTDSAILIIVSSLLLGLLISALMLFRGRSSGLTLSIFLLGLNAIVRIMMFFPHATYSDGTPDLIYIITSILSISLSTYLLLRMDRVDIRTQMVK